MPSVLLCVSGGGLPGPLPIPQTECPMETICPGGVTEAIVRVRLESDITRVKKQVAELIKSGYGVSVIVPIDLAGNIKERLTG